KLSVLSL
ncbi:shikimate kinase family protein, partial [Chlamydia psittaci 84-8471/1]